jgi:hypothetical protein
MFQMKTVFPSAQQSFCPSWIRAANEKRTAKTKRRFSHNKQRVDRYFVSLARTGMARKRNDNYSDQHNKHSSASLSLFYSFRLVWLTQYFSRLP